MQVKAALAEIRTRPSIFPGVPPEAATLRAAHAIPEPAFEVESQPPPDLDEIATRLIAAYSLGEQPGRRDVNKAPWCIWDGKRPLEREPVVMAGFLGHVRSAPRKSTIRRLASAYVVRFAPGDADRPRSALNQVADVLRDLASLLRGPLSEAGRHLHLFDPRAAPRTIAGFALDRNCSPSKILSDFGIQNLGAEAGLAEAAFLAGLDRLRTDRAMPPRSRLAAVASWGTRSDGSIIFEQHRGAYIDALMLPMEGADVERQDKDACLKFLVARFGDPRLRPAAWQPMTCTAIVLRWLTELSLRQFLDVVDQGAYDYQWRYRRAFWEAVHRRGLIQEAWVIFDETGDRAAKRLFDVKAPYALWETGGKKPIQRGHAVLLMLIGRGVVAEWSHQGVCNVWHDAQDPSAPRLRKERYTTDDVQVGGRRARGSGAVQVKHDGSPGYAWQTKLANEIFRLTNTQLVQSEYRV
ncbi:EH signature domain-containing protein [Methylorubrum populi]